MAIDSTTLEYQRSHPMDLVFLLTHQTHAFRMVEFFNLRDTLSVFPEDFAEQVQLRGVHTSVDVPRSQQAANGIDSTSTRISQQEATQQSSMPCGT